MRKGHAFVAALLVMLSLAATAQAASKGQAQAHTQEPQQPSAAYQRGTDDAPVVIRSVQPPKTQEETAEEQADRQEKADADIWMIRLTAILAAVGALQLIVFGVQAWRLKQTIDKMDAIAADQTSDMQASIGQATRAATAMQGVSDAMATNVERLKESLGIQREIADRQKQVNELQSRAYLGIEFIGVVPQGAVPGYRFEPRVRVVNNGLTPAYQVKMRAAANVLPMPLADNFDFPLPSWNSADSLTVVGPRQVKLITAAVPRLYPPVEVDQICGGAGQRIVIWGEVMYVDAFGIGRFVKFSMSMFMLSGGTWMSSDTAKNNQAD